MTQKELACKAEVNKVTIAKIENEKFSSTIDILDKIISVFNAELKIELAE